GHDRQPPLGAGVRARARRGSAGDSRLDLARLTVLVVNAGSTSLKLHIVDGYVSRAVESLDSIPGGVEAVARRVVHGGELRETTLIDDSLQALLGQLAERAP